MAFYHYKATNSLNETHEGTTSGTSAEEVAQLLKKRGLRPVSIREEKEKSDNNGSLPPVEKITFSRYVSTIVSSGLSLSEGIPVLKEETKNPLMKKILTDITYHLEQGQPLSTALKTYPNVFNDFFIKLVEAGEVSGTLGESFRYLEIQLRADYSLSQKVKSSLVYPAVVFAAMIGIGYMMFFFILPQIGQVFLRMSIPLPTFTKILFTSSIAAAKFKFVFLGALIVIATSMFLFFRNPGGKKILFRLISPIPLISNLLERIDVARFCRIFSTLLSSAVPIIEALQISLSSMTHPKFEGMADIIVEMIREGTTVSAAFKERKLFPPLLTQMISAGEKSGTLDVSLGDLAEFYEEEVEEAVKKATQLIEPVLMLIVGVGVGAMILSIIAPMYSVVGNLQGAT